MKTQKKNNNKLYCMIMKSDDIKAMEKDFYDYLLFLDELGINSLVKNDIEHNYMTQHMRYDVILYQSISNQYLLLVTNLSEDQRYYSVLLLNSNHELLECKRHSKLENAINDFKNQFYDLKIKEHEKCEEQIQHSIEEFIEFLKDRNEEIL